MKATDIEERVKGLLCPILRKFNLELYDVEWLSAGRYNYLRIFIDKEGGVTIRDCELVSKEIGEILDREDFIEVSYYLEVSSPGLTRELKKPQHFMKSVGCLAKVVVKEDADRKELTGRILVADEEG
ncbi:MAG: ribosome maturation factor RimP, partial [Thermosulfidibacteraceae bacterium]